MKTEKVVITLELTELEYVATLDAVRNYEGTGLDSKLDGLKRAARGRVSRKFDKALFRSRFKL